MRNPRVFRALLGVQKTVIEAVEVDEEELLLVVRVRPARGARDRCGVCRRRCGGYDRGEGRRRWRALDAGAMKVFIEADAPRVCCPEHGVVVAHVPWARHGAGHTLAFDDTVAWLVTQCSKTAVTELMRIAWRTVGAIIARVWADVEALGDRLDGLTRIGIDEISYKRGYRYLTVVVDHDTGRLLWAAPGHDRATLCGFFDRLGPVRCVQITHVSADQAPWIAEIVAQRCPGAVQCADPFHIIKWAIEALDDVRRQAWNDARAAGQTKRHGYALRVSTGDARRFKGARYALWKNPDKLTDRQREKLAWIAKTDPRLHRAYLLKEGLRYVFIAKGKAGKDALDRWLAWARRCRIPAFVRLARRIAAARDTIYATLDHGLSNALIRIGQHQDPPAHSPRVRISISDQPDRTRDAQPRWPSTPAPQPNQPTDQSLEPLNLRVGRFPTEPRRIEAKYGQAARNLGVERAEVVAALAFIREHLQPYPALEDPGALASPPLVPDIAIRESGAGLSVELLERDRLQLAVSPAYERALSAPLTPDAREAIRRQLRAAREFIDRLEQRWRTIAAVAEVVAERQCEFVRRGARYLVPLTRAEVACELGVHESTVSRTVAGRNVLLPSGRSLLWLASSDARARRRMRSPS